MNNITTKIKETWSAYDKMVAECHLQNYGKIYLDEYGQPIDNEFDLQELNTKEQLTILD